MRGGTEIFIHQSCWCRHGVSDFLHSRVSFSLDGDNNRFISTTHLLTVHKGTKIPGLQVRRLVVVRRRRRLLDWIRCKFALFCLHCFYSSKLALLWLHCGELHFFLCSEWVSECAAKVNNGHWSHVVRTRCPRLIHKYGYYLIQSGSGWRPELNWLLN